MRLIVRRGHSLINELRFPDGPVYIGRKPQCHIFLPDRSVSRQHAVLYTNEQGVWILQDLKSANQTILNGNVIDKTPIHEGDVIGISDFVLEVHFDPEQSFIPAEDQPLDLDETIIAQPVSKSDAQYTSYSSDHTIHLTPTHMEKFYHLHIALYKQDDEEALLSELGKILLEQFNAYHVWAGLRETTSGPLTCYGGCKKGGQTVRIEDIPGKHIIKQALDEGQYILAPDINASIQNESSVMGVENLHSAMAAPIVAPAGTYGVIYLDNAVDQPTYSLQDLCYLTLVSTQAAAFLEHIG